MERTSDQSHSSVLDMCASETFHGSRAQEAAYRSGDFRHWYIACIGRSFVAGAIFLLSRHSSMNTSPLLAALVFGLLALSSPAVTAQAAPPDTHDSKQAAADAIAAPSDIYVRTEDYPRPPYSGATYYIYEKNGAPICTKLAVCNKYGDCQVSYRTGVYKDPLDFGAPYRQNAAVPIPGEKLKRHACLTKFKLQ